MPAVRNATRCPGRRATSVTTTIAGTSPMCEPSSRIHGSESQRDAHIHKVAKAKAIAKRWWVARYHFRYGRGSVEVATKLRVMPPGPGSRWCVPVGGGRTFGRLTSSDRPAGRRLEPGRGRPNLGSAEQVVHVAPPPRLARLDRAHHRVPGLLVVQAGVLLR